MQYIYYIKRFIKMIAFNRLIPYKLRKPLILLSSMIGLIFFYNFILKITDSIYLHQVGGWLYPILFKNIQITTVVFIVLFLISAFGKKYHNHFKLIISVLYVIVLALGILGALQK